MLLVSEYSLMILYDVVVSESMAAFLAAEVLTQHQSVAESDIEQAMSTAEHRQYAYNASRPKPKGMHFYI